MNAAKEQTPGKEWAPCRRGVGGGGVVRNINAGKAHPETRKGFIGRHLQKGVRVVCEVCGVKNVRARHRPNEH